MKKKISMGKIDYINASPVYYGLDHGLLPDWIEMLPHPPAVLNGMIENSNIEISPVSAGYYGTNYKDLLVLPDLSISCHGQVLSVILMSNYPIESLHEKKLLLTRDSATSSYLVKLIMAKKDVRPQYETCRLYSLSDVSEDADAAMIIGDAAMTQPWEDRFKYRFDLGEIWFNQTGLPFVFALWVVRKEFAENAHESVGKILELFYRSRTLGYDNIEKVISAGASKLNLDTAYVTKYFDLLKCDLDSIKIKALKKFFDLLYDHEILPEKVDVDFFA